MAKAQKRGGRYRQMLLEQRGQKTVEETEPGSFFRLRFYLCLCLFIAYLILDYTKASISSIDSSRIQMEISRDMTAELDLEETLQQVMNSITNEVYIK